MADSMMVPVMRGDLVTRDMDEMAALIRQLYFEHTAQFSCAHPGHVDGALRSADVAGLSTTTILLGGFTYASVMAPVDAPSAFIVSRGGGMLACGGEEVPFAPGSVMGMPAGQPGHGVIEDGGYLLVRVPWQAACSLAEEMAGVPARDLRFASMAPVSAARQRIFTQTGRFIQG